MIYLRVNQYLKIAFYTFVIDSECLKVIYTKLYN